MGSSTLRTLVGGLATASLVACGGGGSTSSPTPTPMPPTPTPAPAGTFAVIESSPGFGATVVGPDSDLQGVSDLTVTFDMTYEESISEVYFVLALLDGTTECLRSQVAYARRVDGGAPRTYSAGTTARYRCEFFVRDNQQVGCGPTFSTNRIRLVLQDHSQIDPDTGLRTLFTEEVSGGWSFVFAR